MRKTRRKKRVFKTVMLVIAVIILIHVISAFTLDKSIEYKEIPFHSARVSEEMDGYKIAFITDTHSMNVSALKKVVSEISKLQPDLLILGGDFTSSNEKLKQSLEVLSTVVTTDGIYGVEGNHDNYTDLFAAMEQYSIHPLSNSGVSVREHFYLAGVEDLWNRDPNIEKATEGAQSDDFVLLIAHNPDVTMIQDTTSVDLVLSGHTHGGQITFFGIWAPYLTIRKTLSDLGIWYPSSSPGGVITAYGQRFMSGWTGSRDGTPVYVSNGTGTNTKTPRVFARPQVILITLFAD